MSTEQEIEAYLQKLKDQNPNFDLEVEFGQMLMRHIDTLTPDERKRYDELKSILYDSHNSNVKEE